MADAFDKFAYRLVSGRPLNGADGYPYLRRGAGRWAGWQRQLARVSVPVAGGVAVTSPREAATAAVVVGGAAAWRSRGALRRRRFSREYVSPTLRAITPALGLDEGRVTLYVDPGLGQLTPRLAKPLSPAEEWTRTQYGTYVEPVLRWAPERVQRGIWWAQKKAEPVTKHRELFRRPAEDFGPRIELTVQAPYLTAEQRQLVSSVISSKIPVGELVEKWDQVGIRVTGRWTVRKRPPKDVGYEQVVKHIDRLKEWEFYLGQTAGNQPKVLSLQDDSPHIAVSAGSGAGKSVLAQLIAVQVLRRGGRVVILDRKGSHRWAIGLEGVDYCTKPHQMHDALIRLARMADERNDLALHEEEGWDPGPRYFVICEELNATIGQLTNFWAETREKGEPKKSPAVAALADLLFMGRSAKVNVLAIAQMLTARAIGGPEARENFGIRCLARYTTNAWKMLVPEASMPRAGRTLGRWQVVIGGTAIEVQVAYLNAKQARDLAKPGADLDSGLSSVVTGDGNKITLRDAVDAGIVPWKYPATKQRLWRAGDAAPKARGMNGKSHLYDRDELKAWAESQS
jgi:hypothetical protein